MSRTATQIAAEPSPVEAARRQIIDAACRHPAGRAHIGKWLQEMATADQTGDMLHKAGYLGDVSAYRRQCMETARLCGSVDRLASTIYTRIGSITIKSDETAAQVAKDASRLAGSVDRILLDNDRILELATVLEAKSPRTAELLKPAVEMLRHKAEPTPLIPKGGEFTLDTPLKDLAVMVELMPEILKSCATADIHAGRGIVRMLCDNYDVGPGNARKQVRDFLGGMVMTVPEEGHRPRLTLTAMRLASHVEVPQKIGFSRFDIPVEVLLHPPKIGVRPSTPLTEYEVLHTRMPKLEAGLARKGILDRKQLEVALIHAGADRSNATSQLSDFLRGKIFAEGSVTELTITAQRIATIAGLTPEVAYKSLIEQPEGADRPADRLVTQADLSAGLRNNPFLKKQDTRFRNGLIRNGITREADVEALYMPDSASPVEAASRAWKVLSGDVIEPGTLSATPDAVRFAEAAGVDCVTAYRERVLDLFRSANRATPVQRDKAPE